MLIALSGLYQKAYSSLFGFKQEVIGNCFQKLDLQRREVIKYFMLMSVKF